MLHELDVTSEVLQVADTSMKDKEDKDKERCKGLLYCHGTVLGHTIPLVREHLGGDRPPN